MSQIHTDGEGKTLLPAEMPHQVPFRHFCNLILIADGDIEKTISGIKSDAPNLSAEQLKRLYERANCAKYWVEECAPPEFHFKLKGSGEEAADLNETEKNAVRLLRDKVIAVIETFSDDKVCSAAIYQIAEEAGIESKGLFRAVYQALIGKDQGPRLASFLRSIEKDRLLGILEKY